MSYEYGYHGRLDKQKNKQLVVDYESPSPIPKRSRTKVQGSKASTYGVFSKKVKRPSDSCSSFMAKLCGNVAHLLPEDSLQKYIDKFLYKLVDPEPYVNSPAKAELKTKFLKPFTDNNMLSFIGMNRKYNPGVKLESQSNQVLYELNDIECNEEDLTKSPKILDYGILEKMRYYKDSNGDYYYLEDSGRKIYDDKNLEKEVTETTDPSIASASVDASTFVHMKALLDAVIQKIINLGGSSTIVQQPRLYIAWILLCVFQVFVGLGIEGTILVGLYDYESFSFVGVETSFLSRVVFLFGLHETTRVWCRMVVKPVVNDTVFGGVDRKERWVEKVVLAICLGILWWWKLRDDVEILVVMSEAKKDQLMEVGMNDFVGGWLYYLTIIIGMVKVGKGLVWIFMAMICSCRREMRNSMVEPSENDDKV
ncbi:hypothetical protein KIW84_030896 [Lathyrus oleraceus]|uniref:Uncharacterized protein n=1 Tax=Pisum sativum TaxID=3888 RepID=A0A9D4XPE2_PEA|nr:hypothetical protein KIW84_030896 [Pisum sativum]